MSSGFGIIGNGRLLAKVQEDGALTEAFFPSIGFYRHIMQSQFGLFDRASGKSIWFSAPEFEVRRGAQTVWRWSEGKVFTQALQTMNLTPNQAVTLTGRWNLRNRAGEPVQPGRYQVTGWLNAQTRGPRVVAEGTLTVTER